jgi:hypothetical protein
MARTVLGVVVLVKKGLENSLPGILVIIALFLSSRLGFAHFYILIRN